MNKDHKQSPLNVIQNRSVANNSAQSGIALPAVTHSRMMKESDPVQGKFVIQQQKEEEETAQFVLQRLETEEKSSSEEKMPFQLQTNNSVPVIQRALNVNFKSEGNTVSLSASGRPKWATKVTKKLKLQPGESRGHIIEWSTRLRAFVNEINQLNKVELLAKFRLGKTASDDQIQHVIFEHLKEVYNDLSNLSINDTEEDNDEGGLANTLAQKIDREQNEQKKTVLLKQLFYHSFNPGKDNKGLAKFEEYKAIFAQAWNLRPDVIATWVQEPAAAEEEKKEAPKKAGPSREFTRENQIASVKPVREKEEVNISSVIKSVEADDKKGSPREKEEVNVRSIIVDIRNGIHEVRRKDLALEQLVTKSINAETFNSLKDEFSLEIDEIMRKITFLHEGRYIKPEFAAAMLKALLGALST